MAVTSAMLAGIWSALRGPDRLVSHVVDIGQGAFAGAFAISDFAAATTGVAALALAEFAAVRGGVEPSVAVDRRLASLWFAKSIRPVGWALKDPWDPIAGNYAARDGWVRLHTNAPHHRAAALSVLGVGTDRAAVTQAVAAARLMGLATLVEAGGVLLRDRASTWWRLRAGAGHAVRAVELLVEDVDVTTRFLAGMGFAAAAGGFAAGNGVAISVRGRADFAPEAPWLGRRPNGPIAMPAIGCATLGEVNARVAAIAAHGIGIDVAARMHPWGFRAAYLTDPSHNVWEIYTTERTDV